MPCPFCGFADSVIFRPAFVSEKLTRNPEIGCSRCDYMIEGNLIELDSEKSSMNESNKDLIEWWNDRWKK